MPITSWAPAYDQSQGSARRIVAARVNTTLLDDIARSPFLAYAVTPLAQWLMDDTSYTPPPGPRTTWPPTTGRGHPRTR